MVLFGKLLTQAFWSYSSCVWIRTAFHQAWLLVHYCRAFKTCRNS